MHPTLSHIETTLRAILLQHCPPLQVQVDTAINYEVRGTKPCMQGKTKVSGIYFASVVPKPKDIRFYFFPNYTHPAAFADDFPAIRKSLKGKSCFHIKSLTPEIETELAAMVQKGVQLFEKEGWL